MKKSNKIISFLLSAIIVVTTFLAVGPVFSVKADAAITINGINQPDINISDYESYRNTYFGGESTNWPTEFVIPGLEYPLTPQSVAYWEKRDWILISAINSNGSGHRVYALDAKSADFVAAFTIWNSGGVYDYLNCMNFSIAVSEHNLYMISNNASTISYFPLSQMDITLNSDVGQNKKTSVSQVQSISVQNSRMRRLHTAVLTTVFCGLATATVFQISRHTTVPTQVRLWVISSRVRPLLKNGTI
ncbi:MAG: hypothetical protein J6K64_04195 [Clostridia bacterium]|nr:hypothetical protein [Clostridia bacterium]